MSEYGCLQHGNGNGPFRTEKVRVKMEPPFDWFAYFEGKWRKVYVQINRTYIVFHGEKITIQIVGV